MRKTAALNSSAWVELATLAPGQSHYWFFDPSWDAYGWVFQATAYPEMPDAGEESALPPTRVEVTELFVLRLSKEGRDGKCLSRINITATNCGDRWAAYSLWVASIPPRKVTTRLSVHRPLICGPQTSRIARKPT